MDAGLMRHRIRIQAQTAEKNKLGERVDTWTDVVSVRASVNPISGREFMAAMQDHAAVTHRVTIRYNRAVRASMRILYGDRVFEILHIIDTFEQHREMTLLCKEMI